VNTTLLWVLVALTGFVATFSAMALGVGLVLMVFEQRRAFARRLAGVSAILVAISLAGFVALLTQVPA
jgi:cytochrome c biogenesis protein CcdA